MTYSFIELPTGEYVYLDNKDYNVLSKHKWSASPSGKKTYASTNIKDKSGKSRKKYMHRMIVLPKAGMQVDHINGNSLDNRRENLRLCRPAQNAHNRGANKSDMTSDYKGVRKENNKYRMTISRTFSSERDAAIAYNDMAKILFGSFAYQNEVE